MLPGVSTLVRLVASRRDAATQRLWETLYALLTDEQKLLLDKLLEVDDGDRHSTLDKLRRPPTRVSGPAMIGALERAAEILGLGFAEGTSIYPSCFAYPSPHSINNQTIKNIPKHGSWMWVLGFGTRSPASGGRPT